MKVDYSDGLNVIFLTSIALTIALIAMDWEWQVLIGVLAGWYLADLTSGIVHLYLDYRPSKKGVGLEEIYFWRGPRDSQEFLSKQYEVYKHLNPIDMIAYNFKKHHRFPGLLGRHGFWYMIKGPIIYAPLLLSILTNLAAVFLGLDAAILACLVTLSFGTGLMQYFHSTLHKSKTTRLILIMRHMRLLLKPEDHVPHHQLPVRDYGLISGWSNPVLNLIAHVLRRSGILLDDNLEPRSLEHQEKSPPSYPMPSGALD
jgi:hypothetical protein